MTEIRWGIVSTGRIANSFVIDCATVPNTKVSAVAARSRNSAQAFADRHGIETAYEGYQALFDDESIDAVYVATPHTLHFDHTAGALKAGKAVLCEKPMSVSADQCARLLSVAASTGSYLMEGMWTWFLPAIRKAREWVDEGRIGAIKHIKADFGYPQVYDPDKREYDASLAGGCLLEMGIYPVAIADYFAAREPLSISASAKFATNGVEDDVVMHYDYGDFVATLATSFRCRLQNSAYIIGDAGYIAIPDFFRASECFFHVLDECRESFSARRDTVGFDYEIEAMVADIAAGKTQSDIVPLSASLRFQQLMDRTRSAFTG